MPSTPEYPVERQRCPEHFQARLNQVGGLNRYGQPNFKLAWAQTETLRQGGEWEAQGEQHVGYRDVYLGDGLPHWMLLQWADAGKSIDMPHLSPQSCVSFYAENECPKTHLQLLGEYPHRGSYQIALPLLAKWFEQTPNGPNMKIRAFPLSTEIIEMMVPIIKASMEVSVQTKMRFMKDEEAQAEAEYAAQVEDAYQSCKLSAAARGSEWIQDKVRSIEKHWNAALLTMMNRNRFFQSQHRV